MRVLEVGCGPIATLVVPLMTIFSPEEVLFTLLEIHPDSLESAKCVVRTLGLAEHVAGWESIDASSYRLNHESPPDIILMEIMRACLKEEPQVPVTRHLIVQAPDAILIPEEVRVDLTLADLSRELEGLQPAGEPFRQDRVLIGPVFVLNRETVDSWRGIDGDRLPAACVQIPDPLGRQYSVMLFTNIRVYQNHVLEDYSCSLSLPKHVPVKEAINGGDTIRFHYELGPHPRLKAELHRK